MEYLIDTHTLIWSLTDSAKLSKKAKEILESEANTIYVSAVCFWEISLKFSIGKLELHGIVPSDFPALTENLGFNHLALSPEDAATYTNPSQRPFRPDADLVSHSTKSYCSDEGYQV